MSRERDAAVRAFAVPSTPLGCNVAPQSAPSPNLIDIVATSAKIQSIGHGDRKHFGRSEHLGSRSCKRLRRFGGASTLEISGNILWFKPGPVRRYGHGTSRYDLLRVERGSTTSLSAADLQSAGNLAVQIKNADGTLSNTVTFAVVSPGSGRVLSR